LEGWQEEQESSGCAFCQTNLKKGDIKELPEGYAKEEDEDEREKDNNKKKGDELVMSTKISGLINALKDVQKNHPKEKSIIFSQFTTFLDILQREFIILSLSLSLSLSRLLTPPSNQIAFLKANGIRFTRLDGSMPQKQRSEVVSLFKSSSGI